MMQCEAVIITLGGGGSLGTTKACPNPAGWRLANAVLGAPIYQERFYCHGHGVDRLEFEHMKGNVEVALFEIDGGEEE